eukprot:CAMPEP_0172158822 /NCGR_PEP_ID=MMETSP1050-20130122/4601_1 /TAXON_ID=233186 /ORGANISM="Cryptomonas curvata, Strain CCAP979/52" /LENGTH=130 /DNA_ID=CAMNT_0012828287 /DNA_START=325 /DNA_END=714 /DNA_ORIENTATION=+
MKKKTKLAQWYVVLDPDVSNQHRHHLSSTQEISSIRSIGQGTLIVTGPSSTPLRLSSARGVRWVGKRPDSHKLDPALRSITEDSNATDPRDWRNLTADGAHSRMHWRRVLPHEPPPDPSRVTVVRSIVAL